MGSNLSVNQWNGSRLSCLINYVKQIQTNPNEYGKLPYISVGSGTGLYERLIMDRIKDTTNLPCNIICIDNLTDKYDEDKFVIKPNYSTVDDMLKDMPELESNCNLLLFWPYSEGLMEIYCTEKPYDIDAISKLKPKNICILYEIYGGAGSYLLHAWLNKCGVKNNELDELESEDIVDELVQQKYKLMAHDGWHHGTHDFLHLNEKYLATVYLMVDDEKSENQNEEPIPFIEHEYKDEINVNLVFKEALKDLFSQSDDPIEAQNQESDKQKSESDEPINAQNQESDKQKSESDEPINAQNQELAQDVKKV
jgi:hypothetical protein